MKANKSILRTALLASFVILSACNQSTNTTNQPTSMSPAAEAPPTSITSPAPTEAPPGPTETKSLAELASAAAANSSFKTLTKVVQAAGLNKQLTAAGPYTVFAPNDAAFAALPKGSVENFLKPENKDKLIDIIAYHVVPGQVTSSQLTPGQVKTVQGTPITIKIDSASNTVTVNNAKVIQADIPASNGVVHIIDRVILPPL